jgi:hypothetical protein
LEFKGLHKSSSNSATAAVDVQHFDHHSELYVSVMLGIKGLVGLSCSTSQVSMWVTVFITEPHWLKQ